ncbi:MAG TPA: NTP transferase domain-containing protein [Polyangiaceae bacterium]|nr:NTP transferase domain-containing protein [Polyangiaceae bacterium]
MLRTNITRAVILAAGTGSRLAAGGDPCPKPLRKVGGKPLLGRVLRTLQSAGVREAVIVIGHQGARLQRELKELVRSGELNLELHFVENKNYLAKNGVSLLAAADYIDQECFLSMADHLYSKKLVKRLAAAELPQGACGLGVDYDIPRCFDLDDATKVRVSAVSDRAIGPASRITDIAKELPSYDALDTGVFRIGPALIEELRGVYAKLGDCSLSDGVKALSQKGQFWACDVGNARWIDVDTPAAYVEAERLLRAHGDDLSGIDWTGIADVVDSAVRNTVGWAMGFGPRSRPIHSAE